MGRGEDGLFFAFFEEEGLPAVEGGFEVFAGAAGGRGFVGAVAAVETRFVHFWFLGVGFWGLGVRQMGCVRALGR